MAFGLIIGALAGAAANGVSSYMLTKKNAAAYKSYAKDIRNAANKYSGQEAYSKMQQGGNETANTLNQMDLANQASQAPQNNSAMMANAANLGGNFNGFYNQGQENTKTGLQAQYSADTQHAQQDLNQANVDYKAGTAATQAAMNTAGGLASLYAQHKGNNSSNMTSDENAKEYNNKAGLPKADVEDALRQIEAVKFQYKPETGLDNDLHVGTTAQSFEGTAFDDVVNDTKPYKSLDKQKLLESVMAGIAALQKEVDELEGNNNSITSDERCKQAVEKDIEAISKAVKQNPALVMLGTRPNFHDNDPAIERMQARIDKLNNPPIEKDEDFLGPDEYIDENGNIQVNPNWKPENADEDFVGPDEMIDENGNIVPKPSEEPNTEEEPVEENTPSVGLPLTDTSQSVGGSSQPSIATENADVSHIEDTTAGNSISSQSVDSPDSLSYSSGSASEAQKADDMIEQSKATTAAIKDATNESENPVMTNNQSETSGFTTNNGGSLESAGTNKDGSFVSKNSKLEGNDGHSLDSANSDIDLTESTIENLIAAIDKLDDSVAATYNIDKSAYTFNGTAIKDLRPEELNELRNIVMSY